MWLTVETIPRPAPAPPARSDESRLLQGACAGLIAVIDQMGLPLNAPTARENGGSMEGSCRPTSTKETSANEADWL